MAFEFHLGPLHIRISTEAMPTDYCGKINYRSEKSATRAAQEMNCKSTTRRVLEPYRCTECDGWHTGGRS